MNQKPIAITILILGVIALIAIISGIIEYNIFFEIFKIIYAIGVPLISIVIMVLIAIGAGYITGAGVAYFILSKQAIFGAFLILTGIGFLLTVDFIVIKNGLFTYSPEYTDPFFPELNEHVITGQYGRYVYDQYTYNGVKAYSGFLASTTIFAQTICAMLGIFYGWNENPKEPKLKLKNLRKDINEANEKLNENLIDKFGTPIEKSEKETPKHYGPDVVIIKEIDDSITVEGDVTYWFFDALNSGKISFNYNKNGKPNGYFIQDPDGSTELIIAKPGDIIVRTDKGLFAAYHECVYKGKISK